MKTVQISIPEGEYENLKRLAEKEGLSLEDLAASGIQEILHQRIKKPHQLSDEDIQKIEAGLRDLQAGDITTHADTVVEMERYLET